MPIYLKNCTFIDWQTLEVRAANLLVEEGYGGKVKETGEAPPENKRTILLDCRGKLVTRSFACGHHHAYSALAGGMPPPRKTPENFREILEYVWWTLDKCLDRETIEASALATAAACAKNGVTFVIDHHASPYAVEGSLEIIAKAFDRVGISHLLCYEISDRDGSAVTEKGLRETELYLAKRQGLVGMHASFTVSDKTLEQCVALAEKYNSGIHMHVAEDDSDETDCLAKHFQRIADRLLDFGALNFEKTILAHCIHVDSEEREILRKSKAWTVQNTESNLNNNVGTFSDTGLGERIMLGTDGMHSDMLRSAKASFLEGQRFDGTDAATIYKRFRNVHNYLQANNFVGDGENNLLVLDYNPPTEINSSNFLSHFIYGLESKHILHVISSGRLIVRDRELQFVKESEILEFSREMSKKLWSRIEAANRR